MKTAAAIFFIMIMMTSGSLPAADINYDTLSANGWMHFYPTGDFPFRGGDIHCAIDTAGYYYMFGGCTNGNGAGGTHNSDFMRLDLNTGVAVKLANCANNIWGWQGSCQAGHAYDINRNCIWFGRATNSACATGQKGLFKFQCPNGPAVRVNATEPCHFLEYDPVLDRLYTPDLYDLNIYACKTNTWRSVPYPFRGGSVMQYKIPSCFDSKRRLFVMTLTDTARDDIYCFHLDTETWETKTPPRNPGIIRGEMDYDPVIDRYVYLGGSTVSEVWYYSYDDNTWTQAPRNGRAYNDANIDASTWVPVREVHPGSYCYSPKHGVIITWGGGQYASSELTDHDNPIQPVWVYRTDLSIAPIENLRMAAVPELAVWPNPFHAETVISINGMFQAASCKLSIFDIHGRQLQTCNLKLGASTNVTWDASGYSAGVYFIRVYSGQKQIAKPVYLTK